MLESKHVIAHVVADLDRLAGLLNVELFATPVLKNGLTLFVRALILPTPLFMLMDEWKEDQLTTVLASNFEDVDELL